MSPAGRSRFTLVFAVVLAIPTVMLLMTIGAALFALTLPNEGIELVPAYARAVTKEREHWDTHLVAPAPEPAPEPAPAPFVQPLPKIDPRTPVAGLLSVAPRGKELSVYVGSDLESVPEVMLEAAPTQELTAEQWRMRKAFAAAAALHLNAKEEDGYLKKLLHTRPDLAGLGFLMGDACKMKDNLKAVFKAAAERARKQQDPLPDYPDRTWSEERRQQHWQAHRAVASQTMSGNDIDGQLRAIRALSAIPSPEATQALARVAVFASKEAIRARAIEALSVRRERDFTAVLVAGLRYPWPPAAENAAQAIVKLDLKELTPHLAMMLEAPDPRSPRTEEIAGRKVTVAPELVRINHLRNCLLCHAPAERGKTPADTLVAEVPVPKESLPYYDREPARPDATLLVRIDVTYLRQDFSVLLPVVGDSVWPDKQRFDFVVRKRLLTAAEADALSEWLAKATIGGLSPYQQAARHALRELTGRDLEPLAKRGRRPPKDS